MVTDLIKVPDLAYIAYKKYQCTKSEVRMANNSDKICFTQTPPHMPNTHTTSK